MKKKATRFTFIDLFAGIGGFRIALEELEGNCVGFSEVDKNAIKVYKENFNTCSELELGDITKVSEYPSADIITGGVPCQSWSIAGRNRGFDDPRGKLWEDSIIAVEKVKPKAFIFENVKGLADPRNKENLGLIISELSKAGYEVTYQVLNAFDYGLPQNRERIFIVGIRKDLYSIPYKFPKKDKKLPNLSDILETEHPETVRTTRPKNLKNSFNLASRINKGNFFIFSDVRNGDHTIHSWDLLETTDKEKQICLTILRNRRKSRFGPKDGNPMSFNDISSVYNNLLNNPLKESDLRGLVDKGILKKNDEDKYEFENSKISSGINGIYRIFLPESHVYSTLTKSGSRDYIAEIGIPKNTQDKNKYFIEKIFNPQRYREITVREAARLQSFPDFYKFNTGRSTAMGLLGNAVAVKLVRKVTANLLNILKYEK